MAAITLLTDLGWADETVGVLSSLIADGARSANVVHLTHEIEPFDVRGGSLALARAIAYVAPGVVVAAVDPDTDRSVVAIEIAQGKGVLIGPDNGLLAPAAAMAGGAERAVLVTNPDFRLESPGRLLTVRDVMVPAAVALVCGEARLEDLGPVVDPGSLLPGVVPITRWDVQELVAEVLWVNRYGDVQLNVDPAEIEALGEQIRVRLTSGARTATFLDRGGPGLRLVRDPFGLVAIHVERSNAAFELDVRAGDLVHLSAGTVEGVTTAVSLRR